MTTEGTDLSQTTLRITENHNPSTKNLLRKSSDLLLTYQLPNLVDATQKRWKTSLKTGTTTSSILTLVSVQLLIFYKSLVTNAGLDQAQHRSSLALVILSYCSFLFNSMSVSISILLLSRLGSLPKNASRRDQEYLPRTGYLSGCSDHTLLRLYNLDLAWKFAMYYWVICFLLGFACLLAQVMLYVWMVELLAVKTVTTAIVGLTFLPAMLIFFLPNYCLVT